MLVTIAGITFWVLTIAVLLRLVRIGTPTWPPSRGQIALWIAVVVVAAAVYFRPHEDILGGQDGGAYLAFGARLAREPHVVYKDHLLAQAPLADRDYFLLYGQTAEKMRPYRSKFACGRVIDLPRAIIATWFQPAYPIVMSVVARAGKAELILLVVPLFVLFTALALRAVAAQIFEHRWAGGAAMVLYLASPLVIYQGRNPRPEIIASFLLFSGFALLIRAWRTSFIRRVQLGNRRSVRNMILGKARPGVPSWLDVVLGSLCIIGAPFFHVTAWLAVIPTMLFAVFLIASGRIAFLWSPFIALAGLSLFLYQSLMITGIYSLRRLILPMQAYGALITATIVGGLLILIALGTWRNVSIKRQRLAGIEPAPGRPYERWLTVAAVLLALGCSIYLSLTIGRPETLPVPIFHYIYRTDLWAVANMVSLPIAFMAGAGLVLAALMTRKATVERRILLFCALPGALLIGNIYDLFTTRYMLPLVLPMIAIGLTAFICLIPEDPPRRPIILGSIAILALLGLPNRLHLVRVTENKGLLKHLEQYARPIKAADGMLLFEYAVMASPFDHWFAIPTLSLPREWLDDYSRPEAAWEKIMRANPAKPAFFATPFQPPISDRFTFTPVPVPTPAYECERIASARWGLPRNVKNWGTDLKLYRMTIRGTNDSTAIRSEVFSATIGPGNMGVRRFENVAPGVKRQMVVDGVPLARGCACEFPIPQKLIEEKIAIARWVLFGMDDDSRRSSSGAAGAINFSNGAVTKPVIPRPLPGGMWIAEIGADILPPDGKALIIIPSSPIFLLDVLAVGAQKSFSLAAAIPQAHYRARQTETIEARWARQGGQVYLPPHTASSLAVMFATAPMELSKPSRLTLSAEPQPQVFTQDLSPGRWRWIVAPAETLFDPATGGWLTIATDQTFHRGISRDLALLVGYVGVLP